MAVIGTWNPENPYRPGGGFGPRDAGERARYGAYALFRSAAGAPAAAGGTVRASDHLPVLARLNY
jgi:hypothetical protein